MDKSRLISLFFGKNVKKVSNFPYFSLLSFMLRRALWNDTGHPQNKRLSNNYSKTFQDLMICTYEKKNLWSNSAQGNFKGRKIFLAPLWNTYCNFLVCCCVWCSQIFSRLMAPCVWTMSYDLGNWEQTQLRLIRGMFPFWHSCKELEWIFDWLVSPYWICTNKVKLHGIQQISTIFWLALQCGI